VLVASNLKDFDFAALAALGVKVQTPDDFLPDLFDANPALNGKLPAGETR